MNSPPQLHSPLADVERAFRSATQAPALLALEGHTIGADLPPGRLPLDELRRLLLHGPTSYATKDRALGLVASRAQAGDDLWTLGFAGLLMPGLKRVTRRLRQVPGVDRAEVGSEVIVALLEAIVRVDPSSHRIAARVCWDVYRRASQALGVRRGPPRESLWPGDVLPGSAAASTNPEEVLVRAVRAGAITLDDAELIAITRIEGRQITDLATALALPSDRLQKRRMRAEARLTELLRREGADGLTDAPGRTSSMKQTNAPFAVAPVRYRSRPGGRLPGVGLSPSDAARWSIDAATSPADGLGRNTAA